MTSKKALNIDQAAFALGFDLCGVAPARALLERERGLRGWINSRRRGELGYMERNVEKRIDPRLLFDGARSVVMCGVAYNRGCRDCEGAGAEGGVVDVTLLAGSPESAESDDVARLARLPESAAADDVISGIASYARSRDYHTTLRERLNLLLDEIRGDDPLVRGRVFVDTAPILEKSWAWECGLGWVGRNSLLINPQQGSFIMLGVIVTNAELKYDKPFVGDGCGECRACIKACPVGAIGDDRMVDASRCLSALTIEKQCVAPQYLHGRLFGCDICQTACPYNHKAPISESELFEVKSDFHLSPQEWLSMGEEEFRQRFGDTPLERTSLETLKERIRFVTKQ